MSDILMTLPDVVAFVLGQAGETDLDGVVNAVKSRREILREMAAAAVTVGDAVTLADLAPAYLNGLPGTVKDITMRARKRVATVTLSAQTASRLGFTGTKFAHLAGTDKPHDLCVPASCCRVATG